jgi:putative ABC transport system substrate-binding protein
VRLLLVALAAILTTGAAAGGVAEQQLPGVPRVGVLVPGSPEHSQGLDDFREGMRSLGWTEGGNVSIETRFANGDPALLSANAAKFAATKVDVIVAFATLATQAAHQATSTIPIVTSAGDPYYGLVASLARPGGNVTGLSVMWPDLVAKQLEMLKEAVPHVSKVGILLQPGHTPHAQLMTELERAAPILGVGVLPVTVSAPRDLPHRFDEMSEAGADSYFVLNEPRTDAMRDDIAALALRHRLPGVAQQRQYVDAGVLLSYGVNFSGLHRRLAVYVDKILKGAKPADLPVEQPTTFELVVNLKTANELALTIPPSILARADEVIE